LSSVNAQCGSANGQSFNSAPTTNLCAQGTATPLLGTGPWTWTCNGLNGGANVNCSAEKLQPPLLVHGLVGIGALA